MLKIKIKLSVVLPFLTLSLLTSAAIINDGVEKPIDEQTPPLGNFALNLSETQLQSLYASGNPELIQNDTDIFKGQWTEEIGGIGGTKEDRYVSSSQLIGVKIRSGDTIDGLRLIFDGEKQTGYIGGTGGEIYGWMLGKDDQITKIKIFSSNFINGIQFLTASGKNSPKFGFFDVKGGHETVIDLKGKKIYGIKAYYSKYLVSVRFYLDQ